MVRLSTVIEKLFSGIFFCLCEMLNMKKCASSQSSVSLFAVFLSVTQSKDDKHAACFKRAVFSRHLIITF